MDYLKRKSVGKSYYTCQNITCFTPTVTKLVSESGRNWALKIRWRLQKWLDTIVPEQQINHITTIKQLKRQWYGRYVKQRI